MKKPILLYHAGCPDGFGSYFSFWKKHGDEIEYLPLSHSPKRFFGLDKKMLSDRTIFMADICFDRKDLLYLAKHSDIKVEDHHLSAQKDCGDLEFCHFDMNHSGAVLSWKFCFPDKEVPLLLRYIETRDLWKWELPYSETILAAVDSYERTLDNWELLMKKIQDPHLVPELLVEGDAILRYNKILIKSLSKAIYSTEIKGYSIPIINTPFFRSELVGSMSIGQPFAAGYHFEDGRFIFSLRSDQDCDTSVDVSIIAGKFPGGGGHKHSSGFSVLSLDELK